MVLKKFYCYFTSMNISTFWRKLAGVVILSSDNPLDYHPQNVLIVPVKTWKFIETDWNAK